MNKIKKVLLLIGSPKVKKSTSKSLGTYLTDRIAEEGIENEIFNIAGSINKQDELNRVFSGIKSSDLVILSFPLYVDSLPYPVIKLLELIKDNIENIKPIENKCLLVIINSGFPEVHQNDVGLAICKRFAKELGFYWLGGLALGMGGMVGGKTLNELGGKGYRIQKALQLVSEAISKGEEIPQSAFDLMSKPLIPKWLYKFMGNYGWKKAGKKFGTSKLLRDQPFKE